MSEDIKAKLLASRGLGTRRVEVDGVGKVEVRGLTRAEALSIQSRSDLDAVGMERVLLATAMVDPALTEDEVAQWQQAAPAGELEPIQAVILELSGMKVRAVGTEMARFQ
ncbi:hypothetical protein GCM10010472_10850 [Pseudonocardia halophobica]|uniref:Uncharacterized protein n=1 Tax=Pseudonocardia halophobica TaxID=29401 RepID=A0A9W6L4F5_9PSEU|nr:hypothetical protein [Pseudonocardia halophobica]GLL13472.1 hypothetical protein GCM10017577_46160 [Pseudonocardia halophobica]